MKFAHAGFAVKNLEDTKAMWCELGFVVEKEFNKPEPKARVAVMNDGSNGKLELWEFDKFDTKFVDIIGRHIAFFCDDVKKDAAILKKRGYTEVIPFPEGITVDYLFLQDEFGAFYELTQLKT